MELEENTNSNTDIVEATEAANILQDQHGPNYKIMSRMALNDNKAGMEGLDKERINQIIYEASKGSKFYGNERKKEEQLEVRIKEQQSRISKITKTDLLSSECEADKVLRALEEERDLSRTIVHVDMDAFYAAVEMRDDPSLRNKPMAVGGMGMLSTSNYLARRFGVRAAMPGFIGLKLCPALVMVQPNFDKYRAVSDQIRDVISQYDANFCPMSLDEAYLDLTYHLNQRLTSSPLSRMFLLRSQNDANDTSLCSCDLNSTLKPQFISDEKFLINDSSDAALESFLLDNGLDISRQLTVCDSCGLGLPGFTFKIYGQEVEDTVLELRNRVEQRTQLTASAGIAPNMMLAKVCSDRNKPNGQFRIQPNRENVMSFIKDLPIRKISGIGKVTEQLLGALGVSTCTDLVTHRALIHQLFSSTSFHHFMRIAAGVGSTCVERDGERKSISTERTFSEVSDPSKLISKCKELCQNLSEDLKEERLLGKTVTLKIKTVSFEVKTRSQTLPHFTNDENPLFRVAQALLQTEIDTALPGPLRLRLMGVRMSKLCAENESQVSVVDMFKRANKKDNTANQVCEPSQDFALTGQEATHSWIENNESPTLTGYPQSQDSASEDDENDFSHPLEYMISTGSKLDRPAMHSGSAAQTSSPKVKSCSSSDNKVMMKFLTKQLPTNSMNNINTKGCGTSSISKTSADYITYNTTEICDGKFNSLLLDSKSGSISTATISCDIIQTDIPSVYLSSHPKNSTEKDISLPKEISSLDSKCECPSPASFALSSNSKGQNTTSSCQPDKQNYKDALQPPQNVHSVSIPTSDSGRDTTKDCHISTSEADRQNKDNKSISERNAVQTSVNSTLQSGSLVGLNPTLIGTDEVNQNSTPETKMISCPICRQQRLNWPLDELNTHIDLCLNKQAVKGMLQEDKFGTASVHSLTSLNKASKRPAPKKPTAADEKRRKMQPSVIAF